MSRLPILTQHRPLRYLTISLLYVAQGIQTGLFLTALPAYLAIQEVEAAAIAGFIGVIMLPWTLKIISAPIMDRFSFLPMGRRRPWVIGAMLIAVLGYVAMALVPDPLQHLDLLLLTGLIVTSSTAIMDVAVDGMTVDIVPQGEYSKANGYMMGSNTLGLAATIAAGSWALNQFGISATLLGAGGVVGLISLFPIVLRERPGERLFPWTSGNTSPESLQLKMESWGAILRVLLHALIQPASILLALVAFLIGSSNGLFKAFLPILTVQELSWLDTEFSNLMATAGLLAGLIGMLLGGPLIARMGTLRGAKWFLLILAAISLLMGLFPHYWQELLSIQVFVFALQILRTLFLIAFFTACMAICWKEVASTQFTLYMAISNLGISLGATSYGWLIGWVGSAEVFFAFVGMLLLMVLLLGRVAGLQKSQEMARFLSRK